MAINIEMPKLSDTMTEGTLVKWLVKVGDEVEIGDVVAEVETDKATMEMEAFDEGVVAKIAIQEGQKAPVGATLAVLAEEGESTTSTAATPAQASPATTPVEAPTSAPAAQVSTPTAAPANTSEQDRQRVSPYARKLATEKGLDLTQVSGTGPGGRIVAADLNQANSNDSTSPAGPPTSAVSTPISPTASKAIMPVVGEEDTLFPLSSMRKIIADRLLTSKITIPHFYLHVELDAAPLMSMRKQINAQAEKTHGNKYTVNDFIVKALIGACQTVPAVNAAYNGDNIVQFAKIGVSVAIAVEDGLVTPVIKDAASKSMLQVSKEIKDMAKRARDKKLKPNEFDGGTITVSNLGAWGIESFDAIVNPPQAAILSVGGCIEKPVVKDGQIVPGLRMNIGLSCDHRVVDGAVAATFLNEVKKLIENPALMLV